MHVARILVELSEDTYRISNVGSRGQGQPHDHADDGSIDGLGLRIDVGRFVSYEMDTMDEGCRDRVCVREL